MGTMWKTLHINEVIKFYELKPGVAYQKGDYRKDGRRDFIRRLVAIPPEDSHGLQNSPGGSDQFTYKQVDATKPTDSPFGKTRGKAGSSPEHRRLYATMDTMKANAANDIHPTLFNCVVDVIKLKIPSDDDNADHLAQTGGRPAASVRPKKKKRKIEKAPVQTPSVEGNLGVAQRTTVEQEKRIEELETNVKRQTTTAGNLRRDKRNLLEQLQEVRQELQESQAEIVRLKKKNVEQSNNIATLTPNAKKYDMVPTFRKETTSAQGGNPDGEWPVSLWAFLCDCLSTRVSTNVLQQLLRKFQVHFLPWLDVDTFQLPSRAVVDNYRFSMGVAAELCAAMQWAAATSVQCGLDGTDIENVSTINLWGVVENAKEEVALVTIAAARPQGDGRAAKEVEGVIRILAESQSKVDHLMQILRTRDRHHVTIVGGGCTIEKIRSIQNDTCNTALKTQDLLAEAVQKALKKRVDYDALTDAQKLVVKLRCCHHLRALWSTEEERWSTKRLKEYLGDAVADFDQNARVELKFSSYMYAQIKLIRDTGRDQYNKNKIHALRPYVEENHPEALMDSNVGRVVGSRQDAVPETAWKTFPLHKIIMGYCADMIAEGGEDVGNILRTSIFVRGTAGPFVAEHCHNALMWDLVLEPARFIMGTVKKGRDFLSLAPFFDEVYDLGTTLQEDPDYLIEALRQNKSPNLFIFSDLWKTPALLEWLKKRGERPAYNAGTREKKEGSTIQAVVRGAILEYYQKPGWSGEEGEGDEGEDDASAHEYLRRCSSEFGQALHISLVHSCHPVLTAKDGVYCEGNQTEAMKLQSHLRLAHNNNSERPFALAKELRRFFATMRLQVIEGMVLAAQNMTFARNTVVKASAFREAGLYTGFFHCQPPAVQKAIRQVALDSRYREEEKQRMKRHDDEKVARVKEKQEQQRQILMKRVGVAIVAHGLTRISEVRVLKKKLEAKRKNKDRLKILEDQIRFRKAGCGFEYPFPISLLTTGSNALKKTRENRLQQLVEKIIKFETRNARNRKEYATPERPYLGNVYRFDLPTLGVKSDLRVGIETRMSEKASSMVEVVDDAELLTLEEEFVNCAFVDADEIISVGADGEVTNWGRTRIIVAIEWSDETDAYEALTHLANEDGTRKGEGQHLVPAHYIIGEGLRQMIGWHNADMDVDL